LSHGPKLKRIGKTSQKQGVSSEIFGSGGDGGEMIQVSVDDFTRIVVGVDPAMTSGEDADETGIVVVAAGPHQDETCKIAHCTRHGYVLEDCTLPKSAVVSIESWARRVVDAYDEWNANVVVVESNAGHELLDSVLRAVRPTLPVVRPNARENKKARAEPIVALYEQGRIHHIGDPLHFAALEDQMTTWVPSESGGRSNRSPDRLDALVWALWELNIAGARPRKEVPAFSPVNLSQENVWRL